MRALTKPSPAHTYNSTSEINKLRAYRDAIHIDPKDNRKIPVVEQPGHVLIASWNIANLGAHKRRPSDLKVIAEILSWFELVAVQEIADDLTDFLGVMTNLPPHFAWIFSDRAGNDERSAYVYDTRRITLGPEIGEIAIVESDRKHIKLPGIARKYTGFNRNPYIAGFESEGQTPLLANCHLLFGPSKTSAEKKASMEKRRLEAYAISRWCNLRRSDKHAWTRNIIAMGDFNLPKVLPGELIFDALTKRGLKIPPHGTKIPTNVSNNKDYDQIAVTPNLNSKISDFGVFDFDGAIFSNIFDSQKPNYWRRCAKHYIPDHRLLWMRLKL
ncbi:hypothetical protein EY643_11505 [Halioglobus maricola]|uniref:Endonuclease/exonuclease/phosphatase family protein n=1 Tax=Halioglobus maricola TaxID=2601894 RepID=A0A5P9NL63_9GAMM|nr:endonuclease/exonuclease/phosphatase family protein [Halioglobus maricola]QFU76236.1 hypothetical protein EY643_11505 [Halioglobus maricola]